MTRIRTLDFLPSIFQTETNSQFLSATLDQLVNPPVTKTIQGYVGSKFGYGIDAKDYYVTEPTKVRTDYQLEPGVVFVKQNETTAKDFISYPGILDALKLQGAITDNNNNLFDSQFYSWDSFTNLDMIINYNQYYWLPDGPPAVTVAASTVFTTNDYIVTALPSAYNIRAVGTTTGSNNPTITLLRGGRYNFLVDQPTQFWIQGEPGTSGYSPTQPNQSVREIYGVDNNGATSGVVTFTVPQKDAQDEFNYPGNNPIGVVSNRPYSQINGARLADIGSIDGVTALNGRTVMFYNTGITNETGYVSNFFDSTNYDTNGGGLIAPETITITNIDSLGTITADDVSNLEIGQTVTFTGTSFGGINAYDVATAAPIPVTSMVLGQKYFIQSLGSTDWALAGVTASAFLNAEIVGDELRITSSSGSFSIGMTLGGTGVLAGTIITGYDMVATAVNGVPTYNVNLPQTVAPTTISAYDIQVGKIFTNLNAVTGTGNVVEYEPTIYYVNGIDTGANTFTMSLTLGGDTYVPATADSGSMTGAINQGLYEEGFEVNVDEYFFTIQFLGDPTDPVLRLIPATTIPIAEKITPQYGTQYVGLHFVKNITGAIQLIPYISAPLDTLYYQDGTNPNRVGIIRLIENNETNIINVDVDILGQTNYTSKNGITFTNGLKIEFSGDVIPRSYLEGQYYVQGVGIGIELIPVESLTVSEPFTTRQASPYDILPYDAGPYDEGLNIPSDPDYITIARNAINRNAWSRSNRWFHIDVIKATAEYNDNPNIVSEYSGSFNKAKRPILQFYPDLKLFNSGIIGKQAVDFVDTRTIDAFDYVNGQENYYPDVQTYTAYQGTINANDTPVTIAEILENQYYVIDTLGSTSEETWTQIGAQLDQDGEFEIGVEYVITYLGTTNWASIGGAGSYSVGTTFVALNPGTGEGDGRALKTLFFSTQGGEINSAFLEAGQIYTISTLGTTQWQLIGASSTPYIGEIFTATGPAIGTGAAVQGNGQALPKTVTTIQIDPEYVNGPLTVGMWINDLILNQESRLPTGTRILSIDNTDPYIMTVYWPLPSDVVSGSLASFVACNTDNTDQLLFPGARVVFINDENDTIRDKIYVVNFNITGSTSYPVITLTEAEDGFIVEDDMFNVQYGYNNKGKTYYYDGVDYIQAQQKQTVNQSPLFDIFDNNGVSYGDQTVYNSSSFNGCKLFNYKLGVGINDAILGFPISYSSINNVGDVSFEVSLYTQTFDYIDGGNSITSYVNNGYVYDYTSRTTYNRLIGWQTAVAPSTQYQLFQFEYVSNDPVLVLDPGQTFDFVITLDVPQLNVDDTVWPSLQVFKNNNILKLGIDYTVANTAKNTVITVKLGEDIDTPIQVLILSDKVSQNAYYTIPINLSNNPFNTNPTSVDIGDIRGHYQSIFENNPDTIGIMFGANNYRDLGNMVPWGNRIIQNSASLVLPGAFLRDPQYNLYDALLFNSREYIKFKTLLVDSVNKIAAQQKYDPSLILDEALDLITSAKNQEQPFFWSDMIPNKAPYITNTYKFSNQSETSLFPLSKIYNFSTANYDGVLIYIKRIINGVSTVKQLIRNIDYIISPDTPSVNIIKFLETGDLVIIKEYNQTYGSYIPNTPTKLGLYPLFLPQVLLDNTYMTPTYFIQGHDGSYNKLYGNYDESLGMLVDFRDQAILEYETRVYNNIKLSNTIPIDLAEVVPGYFRDSALSYAEWTEIYSKNFLDWIGQNRLDYKTQLYRNNDQWTYNYREQSTLKLNNSQVLQGNWRGIYEYLYDTSTPSTTPWEMIGYANKPDWWDTHYGPAPWTSDNLVLWTDLQDGIDYNNGTPVVRELYKRPGLLNIIPVDDQGNLREPLDAVIANYNALSFQRSWRVGDDSPVEYSYRKSSTYPFDLMRLEALIKPAKFYNLGADIDNYKYDVEFDQYLVNERNHLVPSEIQIYGNGIPKTSYINWIVDYEKQLGIDATENITNLLKNLDVRLVYRLAGFSDKTLLKFFVEKGTPASNNNSLLIPDESYQVLLYQNQPMTRLMYSGVVVQKVQNGYAVFGNSQTTAYFRTLRPILNGNKSRITVQDVSVQVADKYESVEQLVPYGNIYYTAQEVSQFLMSYGAWLEANGAVFDDQIQNIAINWNQMVAEFLYWTQTGWEIGSVITLNPAAEKLTIDKESQVVQPLTYQQTNFVLNNNLYPIQNKDLSVFRDGTRFSVTPLNEGDAVGYAQFNLSNIEHGIVFQNETLFNDTIYNLISGLKQNRIYVRGTKSGEWNGTLFASGFIYNQDNILEWNPEVKYTKGSIVKYKNKFYTALQIVQPSQKFKEDEWKVTDYDEVQKGLLPNSSTRSYESALYYDTNKANLEQDADLLSFSLIGFRPREYMASADLTDITQVNVYKNMIKEKGTLNALKAFKGANLPQGGIDYDIYENWAILQGTFGGVLNGNFVEFRLDESKLSENPTIVGLTNGNNIEGAQQIVPLYQLFNYGRPVDNPQVLPLADTASSYNVYPDAGYVNINDVKMSAYFYSNLPSAVDANGIIVPINNLYVGDYVWLADYQSSWKILTPTSMGQVVQVRANINGTSTVTFKENHNLSQYDIFSIINFDSAVNGYFVANDIINPREVLITLTLPTSTKILTGQGIGLKFNSQRVMKPGDIKNLQLVNNEFVKNTVWVDENNDGGWAVYRKNIDYKLDKEFIRENSVTFGTSVAYTQLSDYLIGDSGLGKVFRYQYEALTGAYQEDQIITNDVSFGTTIVHEQNVFAISQPTGTPKVFLYTVNNTTVSDDVILYQEISATDNVETAGATNFGNGLALSGDLNWLFISDYDEAEPTARNNVHVFRRINELTDASSLVSGATYQIVEPGNVNWNDLSDVTIAPTAGVYFIYNGDPATGTGTALRVDYEYSNTLDNSSTTVDKFGHSISTNYYGTTLTVGAPNVDYSVSIANYGNTYVFDRLIQNIEIDQAYNSSIPAEFTLAWAADPSFTTITKNGVLVSDSDYSITGTTLTYTGEFGYGDILNISGNEFVLVQTLTNEQTPRIGVQFGYSVDNNTSGTEVIVGAPFYLDSNNQEGAGFRYTYGASRFGIISGTTDVNVTTNRKILINGYLVNISAGDATQAASDINSAGITNVIAQASNNKLTISLVNFNLAEMNRELTISATETDALSELGLVLFTQTQIIQCPHPVGATQFGTTVKFNEHNSVAISAPVGTRFAATTFDFVDDEDYENDTIFDNNATQFIDSWANAGAVYTFDYLGNYNESLLNIGSYTYAQSVNAQNLINGSQPRYGISLDWHDNKIVAGAPYFRQQDIDGQVVIYKNDLSTNDWTVFRQSNPVVDINSLENLQIFSAETNKTLINLDYIDPLQGKILGAVRQNINVVGNIDPASYNNSTITSSIVWGSAQVGTLWFDTSNIRYLNYHQNDNKYNAKYWGQLFPGSDVAVYSWVSSTVPPTDYQGPGTPKDVSSYTVQTTINSSNTIVPIYYFWVRNTGYIFPGKSLADVNIASYISNPQNSGISYLAPLAQDTFALYNCKTYINANDSVLHLGIINGQQDNPYHQEFDLIRVDNPDDFLPGIPTPTGLKEPQSLYDRLLDSMSGVDESGAVVPNPFLPKAVQSGILARPRQSFFYNRYGAMQNYLQYANTIMALFPITEIRSFNFLNTSGTYYDTRDYWEYINWWAVGYDNNTKATIQVAIYADLSALDVPVSTIVTVAQNSNGFAETYIYDGDGVWTRIGLQNGTIRFKDELFDYRAAGFGFGGTFYDTDTYDVYPSEETRYILRALNEQIYTNELLIYRNKSLILLFEYIQEETIENQNYLPWLNKTSLVDVAHKIRELIPLQNFVSDNEEFLEGYVNETKPYHVVVKEFLFDYTGEEVYPGMITDFDVPASYDPTIEKFVSPQLVYQNASSEYKFLPDDPIWQTAKYKEWFDNHGVSITGQANYPIAKLESYITLSSEIILVDNIQGFPINGTFTLGTEKISYSSVDRATSVISGLLRGVNGTQVSDHMPGEQIYMDLPGALILDGGRNYSNPPKVTARIDTTIYPEPTQEAVLEAVMSLDSVVEIIVVDPGQGYAVLPEIDIEPADIFTFDSANVNIVTNTIEVYAPALATGDLVRYSMGDTNIGGLENNQYYYVNVLDSNPTTILALYTSYADALSDNTRVPLYSQGTGTQSFKYGARAVPITSSYPVRENNITIRFDRTSYDTQITDWAPNTFYKSEFVGYTLETSSSNIGLASVQPDINTILASAQGTPFPVVSITNDREVTWSTFERIVDEIDSSNSLMLSFNTSVSDENPSGSTIGFYEGMPIKFTGYIGYELSPDTVYYVKSIVDLEKFTVSASEGGPELVLTPISGLDAKCFTASVTNTAIMTTEYSGYRTATNTYSGKNSVKVIFNELGVGGTDGFYTNLPVYLINDAFGRLGTNIIYYVVSVLGREEFTLSQTPDPVQVRVIETNLANQIIVQNTNGLNVNDAIVFDSISINGEASDTFGNIQKQTIYYIKSIGINVITISETVEGTTFVTGVVPPSANNYCFITSQANTYRLENAFGNATLVIGLPVSPSQVNGQRVTFYPTSNNFADITSPDLTYGGLLHKTIEQTLATYDQIALNNKTNMYVNIPFSVSSNVGGLVNTKTYYAYNLSNIEIECQSTTGSSLVFEATFSGTTMDVTSITSGTGILYPGTLVTGTDVQPNTYIVSYISGSGGTGTYEISTTYFVPVVTTGVSANTGIITVATDFDTDMIYEGMPIVFSQQSLGGIFLDFTYYVRHIIDSNEFTISTVKNEGSISMTTANGEMIGTGSPVIKAYLPVGELITGDDYEIKFIGTTLWENIGGTKLVSGDTINAGTFYIVNDIGSNSDNFWSTVAGEAINVETNSIVYAENTEVMGLNDGTAYELEFIYDGSPQTGTGQATVVLSTDSGPVILNQEITSDPIFDVGYALGGYVVIINDGGSGFTQNNTITIPGDLLGGDTPENDLTLTVSQINSIEAGTYSWSLPVESNGTITKVIASGTPTGTTADYYLKTISPTQFEIYSDSLLQIPVSGIDFPYQGYVYTNMAAVTNTVITLEDASEFNVNDAVVFSAMPDSILPYDAANNTGITSGVTYYITSKDTPSLNDITIATNPGGNVIDVTPSGLTFASGTGPQMTKFGSIALLPQPFNIIPDIVKYNNRVYLCVISNNDSDFVFGKWEELNSGDPRLNALDRTKGFYRPTVNMPGNDLTQLFTGLVYPNTTYLGNAFEPTEQYPLDTYLVDRPFDTTNVDLPAITFNGTNYVAPANLPNYSAIVADIEVQDDWRIATLANQTLGLTDIVRGNGIYIMTSTNSPTPIFKSTNTSVWSTNGFFVPYGTTPANVEFVKQRMIAAGLTLNSVVYHDGNYVAVGKNIIVSDDASMWYERLQFDDPTDKEFFGVNYASTDSFEGYVAVGVDNGTMMVYTSTDLHTWNEITGLNDATLNAVASGADNIFAVGNGGIILRSQDGIIWDQPFTADPSKTYNDIEFADNTFVIVGNNGLLEISTDGGTSFTVKSTGVTENLNSIIYVDSRNEWTIVGENNTVLQTDDITAVSITWDNTHIFSTPEPQYTVQGDPFMSGYGPEEMVPGIVTDQLTMIVNTRAGTNWPATEYAHVGYEVVSVELDVDVANEYSFNNIVQTPAYINVFKLTDGLSITLYETIDYTVDWINKVVSLVTPLASTEQLRIDVYEVGNGDQLIKSSTENDPIERNSITGFDEIILDCNYSDNDFNGGGIILPDSSPISTQGTETDSVDDSITVEDISNFTLNDEVYFAGTVFGGVSLNTPYYVKTINTVRKTFTISASLVSGVAGPTFSLTTDSGDMTVVIQRTSGQFYTEPAVFHNGSKMIAGLTNYVIASSSSTYALTTFSTVGLVSGQPIVFDDTIFGGLTPQTTYYVDTVLSSTEFTLNDGSNPVYLTDGAGSAIFITYDYAVMLAENQINPKVMFAQRYDKDIDYISYSFFGPTEPMQYGFTLPQTQQFTGYGSGGSVGPYDLTNYLGGDNPDNAIVEIDGLRIAPSEYTVDFATDTLTFNSLTPDNTQTIAVTTFNDTQRQYMFTNEITSTVQVTPISFVNNTVTFAQPTIRIQTAIAHGLSTDDVVRIDGIVGSTQLNNQIFIIDVLSTTEFAIYEYVPGTPASASAPITIASTYVSGGYVWLAYSWILENKIATASDYDSVTETWVISVADSTGLISGTPVYFTEANVILGDATSIPEINAGQEYYIKDVNEFDNEFSITDIRDGSALALSITSGLNIRVTQWEQTNVDRLWVTVNGVRVASSKLRLNEANELSILTEILAGDEVLITMMMPSATPDSQTYIQVVDTTNQGSVYRANTQTRTWLTQNVGEFDETIYVDDVTKLTNVITQTSSTPAAIAGFHEIGLLANRFDILQVRIYNNNPARLGFIDQDYISIRVSGLGPFALIEEGAWIEAGDQLTITTLEGKMIYVAGEYMSIITADLTENLLTVQRGAQGSIVNVFIPKYSTVYSLLNDNKMTTINYNDTWNKIPGVYNNAEGDPLQIATGNAANFLRVDVS